MGFFRNEINRIDKADKEVPDDYITRIAEEISYIDVPAGDIPNIQVDGYRTAASIKGETGTLYAALTGDQCAITNIRIQK